MKTFKIFFFIFCFLYIFNITSYVQANQDVDNISKNLRCLICQGQSVYDSQSDFALTIKMLIKNKLQEGESEDEIYDYLKTLYGEWIVYDPEFNKKNLLLWVFPLILFIFGGLLIYKKVFINDHKK
tara:strand:- start:372 stop:749 length:378 start_codon:yes stop_codon:yes gene_type:complete